MHWNTSKNLFNVLENLDIVSNKIRFNIVNLPCVINTTEFAQPAIRIPKPVCNNVYGNKLRTQIGEYQKSQRVFEVIAIPYTRVVQTKMKRIAGPS
jgi:hypothetical protein